MIFRIKKQGDLRLFTVPTRCEWVISFTVPLTRIYFSTPVPEVLPENLVEPEPEPGQPSKQSSVLVQPSSTLTQVLILVHSLYLKLKSTEADESIVEYDS